MRFKSSALICAAVIAVLALAAPPAAALSVSAVSLTVSPASSNGPCPVKFTFTGKVALNGRGEFRYKWERSDGAVDTAGPHTAVYDGTHAAVVTDTWTLGAATPAFHPFHGSVTLHVLAPNDTSSKPAVFTLDCGAPPPTIVPGAIGRPTLPGAGPVIHVARPVFDPAVLFLPAVQVPQAFRGADGKTQPAGPYDLKVSQGAQGILIGLLRNGKLAGEANGKFVPPPDADRKAGAHDFHFDASSKVSFGGGGGAGRISCSINQHSGPMLLPYIEFHLPAVQK